MAGVVPRWIVVDDMSADIQYSGPWFTDSQGDEAISNSGNLGTPYENTLHGTNADASLAYYFNGTQVRVWGTNVNNAIDINTEIQDPTWECFIDQISIGANPPFEWPENNSVFCEQDSLLDGPHVITVNATVKSSQIFWFDQIQYVPSSTMVLDNQTMLIDNPDPQLRSAYSTGWKAWNNTANVTTQANATFSFEFFGVSLQWYGVIPSDFPHTGTTATYSVDGKTVVTFLLNGLSSTVGQFYQKFFETDQLAPGKHQIIVTFQGNEKTTPLALDYLIIRNNPAPNIIPNITSTYPISTPSQLTTLPNPPSSGSIMQNQIKTTKETGFIVAGVIGGIALLAFGFLFRFIHRRRIKRIKTIFRPLPIAPSPILTSVRQSGTSSTMLIEQRHWEIANGVHSGNQSLSSSQGMPPSYTAI